MVRLLSGALTGLALVLVSASAPAATTVTLHTPGPADGAWGKVFRAWSNVIAKRTDGAVELKPEFDSALGAEPAVIEMVKNGKAGGGFFTTRGLAQLDNSILALQVRGAFDSWREFDTARGRIQPDLIRAWQQQNIELCGWADVGIGRFMSRGFAVTTPTSLAGKKVAVFDGDVITPKLLDAVKDSSRVTLGIDAILGGLEKKRVDVIAAPAYAAEQLGWTARLDHINTQPLFFAAGAVLLSEYQLAQMTEEQRALVMSTGARAAKMLDKKLDSLGYSSYGRLKTRLKANSPTDTERKAWRDVYAQACRNLDRTIPKRALDRTGACPPSGNKK
jgi:TRAP-type C4-dicarboxylate transport system substrate-binding protein